MTMARKLFRTTTLANAAIAKEAERAARKALIESTIADTRPTKATGRTDQQLPRIFLQNVMLVPSGTVPVGKRVLLRNKNGTVSRLIKVLHFRQRDSLHVLFDVYVRDSDVDRFSSSCRASQTREVSRDELVQVQDYLPSRHITLEDEPAEAIDLDDLDDIGLD